MFQFFLGNKALRTCWDQPSDAQRGPGKMPLRGADCRGAEEDSKANHGHCYQGQQHEHDLIG